MLISVVIRTLNEELYLGELLNSINNQKCDFDIEIVIIDSGSDDQTINISKDYGARITYIPKEDFSFGRSLNMGSDFSNGNILVYISGHCVPIDDLWLANLVNPIINKEVVYAYGKQVGRDSTKYSEYRIFEKYFPSKSEIPQKNFFCNNANSAILRDAWLKFRFDENLTGLEDMDLGKKLYNSGAKIGYISDASVYHIHNETWTQTRRRYEREAIALQSIMPEVQISFFDMLRYIFLSIVSDSRTAINEGCFFKEIFGILSFRLAQYTGSYRGNKEHREISNKRKENYFYPDKSFHE